MNFSSLLQVTGQRKQERRLAVTYKWSWASALESKDQVPSELPRLLGSGRGSAARKSLLLTGFLQGCLLCKIRVSANFISCMHHQEPANKPTVKHLLKSLKID